MSSRQQRGSLLPRGPQRELKDAEGKNKGEREVENEDEGQGLDGIKKEERRGVKKR